MARLLLIDGFSILNRAFYGIPFLSNSSGLHTNAVYGFLNIMFKMMDDEAADYLAVAFDVSEPTFRHKIYSEYKAKRHAMPDELREQVPIIKDMLAAMNIPILTSAGYEADDIIGTVAKRYASKLEISVISGDRDLLQIADEHIKIRIPKTSKGKTNVYDYYQDDVISEYKVTPREFIDVKALMGDASDNIPGVPSIGEKTATAIISKYHSIENAYEHVEELKPPRASRALKEHYDKATFSKYLVTINCDIPIETELDSMKISDMYNSKSLELMQKLEFKSLLKRFDEQAISSGTDIEVEVNICNENDTDKLISLCVKSIIGLEVVYSGERLVGFALATDDSKVNVCMLGDDFTNEILVSLLKDIIRNTKLIYTRKLKLLSKNLRMGACEHIYDLGIAAYLINPLKDTYNIDDIARDYSTYSLMSAKEVLGDEDLYKVFLANSTDMTEYLAKSAVVLYNSGSKLISKLTELKMFALYTDIELPLVYSIADMEIAGIRVDKKGLSKYEKALLVDIERLEKEIHTEAGEEFNINSPKQLGVILFEKLGLKGGKKTKTGYSTAAAVLDKLASEHSVVNKVLEYRQLTKLHSTYAVGLASYIDEDGRIHGSFNQTITATGRLSSTEPNLQNIPIRTELGSKLRDIFIPDEGYVFVDADYSQIELRILASLAQDEKLIASYKESADIHAATAAAVFHVPLNEVTPTLRRNAKAVNFGVVYGISAFGLSEGLSISRKEALDYINNYFKTYPEVKTFLDKQVKLAKEQGYVRTLYGRIRPIPEIKSSNFMQRAFGDRIAMNSPIQGTAADIIKKAMVDVDRALKNKGYDARIVLQIHDELLIEVNEKDAEAVRSLVEKTMEETASLSVALEVEAHIGDTWLKAK